MMRCDLRDITRGPLAKQILLFSLPLIVSNVLQVLFNMADIAVVGRFAGSKPLGSVGSTTILVALFTGFLIGMGNGVNVLVARHYGAGNQKDVMETVHTALILCLIVGAAVLALGQLCVRPVLRLLGTKPELLDGAVLYLRIYFLGMPALAVYNFGNAVFSAIGNTKKPLYYLSLAGVINIVLNLFFVIVCHLDVAGVAIASIISQYVSAGLILIALHRSEGPYALRRYLLHIQGDKSRQILGLGITAGLQHAIFAMANLFIQSGVNSFDATMVSGNAAAANADSLIYEVMAAFYTACGSFMAQNYGAGNRTRVKKSYLLCLAYSCGVGLVLGILSVVFGPQFLSLFTDDPAVVQAGMNRITVMGLAYSLSAFMDCTIAASRSLGKSVVPTIIVVMGSCVFRIIWIYTIFAYFHTIPSLYLLYVFSWLLTSIAEIIYFAGCYRRKMAQLPASAIAN